MNWGSASAFFSMGGYGLYVWGSYAVVVVLMLAEAIVTHQRLRRALRGETTNAAGPASPANAPRRAPLS